MEREAILTEVLSNQPMVGVITLLIVDDEAIIRAGLRKILSEYSHIQIVGEAASGEEAQHLIEKLNPEVVLMDISMPGIGGIETTRQAIANNPELKILALSVHADDQYPSHILNAGAVGYITKGVNADEMIDAINTVATGEHYICNAVADKIRSVYPLGRDRLFDCLSDQEHAICQDIVTGIPQDTIANRHHLSIEEYESLKANIFERLHIQNDVSLIHLAIKNGLLDKDPN